MSSSLPARRGRGGDGGARATQGHRAAEAAEQRASEDADRLARRAERGTTGRRTSGSARGDGAAGPMGREVEHAPGAGPQVSASELGGRSVPARTAGDGVDTSTGGTPSGARDPAGGVRRAERTRAALRSPSALRQAILAREILGPPAAFQTGHRDVPGLPH